MSPIVNFNPAEIRGYHGRWIAGGPHHAHLRRDLRRAGGRRIAAPKGTAGVRARAARTSVAAKAGTEARAADPWAGKGVKATSQDWGQAFDEGAAEDRAHEEAARSGRGGRGGRGSAPGSKPAPGDKNKQKAKQKNQRNRGGRGGGGAGNTLGNLAQGIGGLAQFASFGGHHKSAAAKAKAKAKARKAAKKKVPARKAAPRVIKPPKAPVGSRAGSRTGAGTAGRGAVQKVTPSSAVLANLARYVAHP